MGFKNEFCLNPETGTKITEFRFRYLFLQRNLIFAFKTKEKPNDPKL